MKNIEKISCENNTFFLCISVCDEKVKNNSLFISHAIGKLQVHGYKYSPLSEVQGINLVNATGILVYW